MGLKNKNQTVATKGTYSVAKEVLYPNIKTGHSLLKHSKNATFEPTIPNALNSIVGIDLVSIKNIEEKINLTFLSEKDAGSYVCMANSPEVRDEFKDIFDIKDLLNYSYAALHAPNYLEKHQDVSKIDFFQVPYPCGTVFFWELVNLGSRLRALNQLEAISTEKHNIEVEEIIKKIAEITME